MLLSLCRLKLGVTQVKKLGIAEHESPQWGKKVWHEMKTLGNVTQLFLASIPLTAKTVI